MRAIGAMTAKASTATGRISASADERNAAQFPVTSESTV